MSVARIAPIAWLAFSSSFSAASPAVGAVVSPPVAPMALSRVVVTGSGRVSVPPAKASFEIGIKTSGPTASAAGTANAVVSKAVRAALARTTLQPSDILGSRVVTGPRWSYENGRRGGRTAYESVNTFRISTGNLDDIGLYFDAALDAGATSVSTVEFAPQDIDRARRDALEQAVKAARADAEAMARAGGGTLGELLLLSTEQSSPSRFGMEEIVVTARRSELDESTELIPEDIQVTARVEAQWRFVHAEVRASQP